MRERSLHTLIRTISWLLWTLAGAFAAHQAWRFGALPLQQPVGRALLAATAWLCLRSSRRDVPRLHAASLIAALTIWPDAWTLIVGLVVLATGRRWRTRRDRRHPIHAVSSSSVAWCLAYAFTASGALTPNAPPEVVAAIQVGLAWAVFELVSWALSRPLEGFGRDGAERSTRAELVNPALAWLLNVLAPAGWIVFLVAPLTIIGQTMLVRLSRTRRELRRVRETLDSRTAELLTLHAVGQELLTRAADNARMGPLLDRECRKLFDPDSFSLLLAHESGLRVAYRREGERRETRALPADPDLARWILEEKRGVCWRERTGPSAIVPQLRNARSALLVPLLVEDRVAGALVVESLRENRYDDHHLAVLTTLAHQAAAALESAHQQRRATIDSLTGFFLRDYFFQRLDEEHRRAKRYGGHFALLMIDLDGFKSVNDRHGHLAGDRYLRATARTIREQLRGADMPCRYGGDEFSLLLPETDLAGAYSIAERIREAVADLEIEAEGALLRGTVSIGLAAFPDHDKGGAKGLMRQADEALYRAKRSGRDRVEPSAA